jgi:hypothetical protein
METGSWIGRKCRTGVGRTMHEDLVMAEGERGRQLEEVASMGTVVHVASLEEVAEECRAEAEVRSGKGWATVRCPLRGAVRMLSDWRRGSGISNRNLAVRMR